MRKQIGILRSRRTVPTGALALLAMGLLHCTPPHVLITVEDPALIARAADTLDFGPERGSWNTTKDIAKLEFPITLALTGQASTDGMVWIRATSRGAVLALGTGAVQFIQDKAARMTVTLRRPCQLDHDCDDGDFCTGIEQCEEGLCQDGTLPCEFARVAGPGEEEADCLILTCIAETQSCKLEPDPRLDDGNPCTVGRCGPNGPVHYADPDLEGLVCIPDDPSLPGSCFQGACASVCEGVPLDDNSPCTIDRCEDGVVVHVPNLESDGLRCPLSAADFTSGLCETGECKDVGWIQPTAEFEALPGWGARSPALSDDGRWLIFETRPAEPLTGISLVRYDRLTGEFSTIAADGVTGESHISGDGSTIVFRSRLDLTSDDTNGIDDIYSFDTASSMLSIVSRDSLGALSEVDDYPWTFDQPSTSDNGNLIAFTTRAPLVPDDENLSIDVYLRDRVAETTERISEMNGLEGDAISDEPEISGDGRYVVFASEAPSFGVAVAGREMFVHDRTTGTTEQISESSPGNSALAAEPSISDDGRFIAYSALGGRSDPATRQIYLYDRSTADSILVSTRSSTSTGGDAASFAPTLSGDGRYLVFLSYATDLGVNPTTGRDLFIFDRVSATVEATPLPRFESTSTPRLSGDGRLVAFRALVQGTVHLFLQALRPLEAP
jgi:Tol biopolymer transport system component